MIGVERLAVGLAVGRVIIGPKTKLGFGFWVPLLSV